MGNFSGVIIEESLENTSVLDQVKVLKTDTIPVNEAHKTPWVKQWTMHTVEVEEGKADAFASSISMVLDSKHAWYADFRNEALHLIIFRNKVFRVDRTKAESYNPVIQYGVSLGIPDYQLDFKLI